MRDLFTEAIPSSVSKNIESFKNSIDYHVVDKICSPFTSLNTNTILLEIKKQNRLGKDHLLFTKYQMDHGDNGLGTNIIIPYVDELEKPDEIPTIKPLILVSHPSDSLRLGRKHIKKMPIFKPLFYDSLISTDDNKLWKSQRGDFVDPFTIGSLNELFSISKERASESPKILWKLTCECRIKVNINEFFLSETMAQLQLALMKLSPEFENETNQKIRDAFSGFGEKGYARDYANKLIDEIKNTKECPFRHRKAETETENYGNSLLFTFAGHDTTGHTLTWLIYELARNQGIQVKLQKEVDQFLHEQGNRDIEIFDLSRLKYMTRCIMETLRLWPAVTNGTFRELEEDDYVIGKDDKLVLLKKGTYVQIFNWARHRNPDLWGEDADIFNPDRDFKQEEIWDGAGLKMNNPYSERFTPFSVPPRDCIGRNFSQLEMRLILINLFKEYNFVLSNKQACNSFNKEYMGINRATLYPQNVYKEKNMENKGLRPYHNGLYVYVIPRKIASSL